MASLQETVMESMIKDLENIGSLEDRKLVRKECSLLLKRIESAKKLFLDNKDLISQLLEIELKTKLLKV